MRSYCRAGQTITCTVARINIEEVNDQPTFVCGNTDIVELVNGDPV